MKIGVTTLLLLLFVTVGIPAKAEEIDQSTVAVNLNYSAGLIIDTGKQEQNKVPSQLNGTNQEQMTFANYPDTGAQNNGYLIIIGIELILLAGALKQFVRGQRHD